MPGLAEIRILPLPSLSLVGPASFAVTRVTLFGTLHNNTDSQIRDAFERHFSERSVPHHIAVELDAARLRTLAMAHGLEDLPQNVYAARDPEARRSPSQAFQSGSDRPPAAGWLGARARYVGSDMAFGIRLAAGEGRNLYLVDRDIQVIRSQMRKSALSFVTRLLAGPFARLWDDEGHFLGGARTLYPDDQREKSPGTDTEAPYRFGNEEDEGKFRTLVRLNGQLESTSRRYNLQSLYGALAGERNHFIANQIRLIAKRHPGQDILVFMGALHTVGLLPLLSNDPQLDVETTYADLSRL